MRKRRAQSRILRRCDLVVPVTDPTRDLGYVVRQERLAVDQAAEKVQRQGRLSGLERGRKKRVRSRWVDVADRVGQWSVFDGELVGKSQP